MQFGIYCMSISCLMEQNIFYIEKFVTFWKYVCRRHMSSLEDLPLSSFQTFCKYIYIIFWQNFMAYAWVFFPFFKDLRQNARYLKNNFPVKAFNFFLAHQGQLGPIFDGMVLRWSPFRIIFLWFLKVFIYNCFQGVQRGVVDLDGSTNRLKIRQPNSLFHRTEREVQRGQDFLIYNSCIKTCTCSL